MPNARPLAARPMPAKAPRRPVMAALGALTSALVLSACAPTPPGPVTIRDPYANVGGVTIYQGNLPSGSLDPTDSAAYFRGTVGDTVLFPADETALTTDARTRLAAQADWLKKHGNFRATIEGHSDEQGTREYNLALGARRAGAVQEYLIAQGVEAGRLRTNTLGKERPIEICSTEACFAKNRRAVTVVSPADAGA